ncbi:glycoside hydrolase family 65 protein [Listeria cossartiae subsp. cayugensis]|uniref:Glycoside hydrolase family 65 protein n=1 Tax=Listeria cossartiae subsp. cayugensis TaxID=2713505 RepID=A0ABU2IPU3_9LIST|nr:glycoside hydrolase family 65 protein [Listeria cossartiae]MDT0050211.1 glycoside hydrolase family 65 protein [Listeria cossartiae subsp. cayugensis]MDT0066743.1 glycoside hydrolase family 65 protein [Listeria cossartiae subsp. cayugensis]MDT0080602.1 glycoside hydrolase family 65 protein [Listeria cossartiae subsp. cayugensis]MDT0082962.1 glycoside hydrolase family 65 protein [Listeria cossartiae subsp. cayugensis]MDT0088946.1 glycoside hydrolase family 65 protein [Listeria cossartiae subs
MRKIIEKEFALNYLNKYGSQMTVGNGYLGVRGALEEEYPEQVRGMYVAGIYNRPSGSMSSELVNLPDVTRFQVTLDGEVFSMQAGKVHTYERFLDMDTGELVRKITWESSAGKKYQLNFHRFVSKEVKHVIAAKVEITPLSDNMKVKVKTGIDAQQTNFGTQQLAESSLRIFDEELMVGEYETIESKQRITVATKVNEKGIFTAKNRQLMTEVEQEIAVNQVFTLEKLSVVKTSLDEADAEFPKASYAELKAASETVWADFWEHAGVRVKSTNTFDQFALDFACYHLEIMTPKEDSRCSVGAKGLTGEGYKGHVFWDTEIFIMPFFLYNQPEIAKQLLQYRYLHLKEAKEKAVKNGYNGALYPWESAFSGEEETPEFAAINIRTGTRQKVASAISEHHLVADIAYAVCEYEAATGDAQFMADCGAELLLETAEFWISRATNRNGRLEILDVIGPDEYTEHIDNNTYTNYMAHYNVKKALEWNKDNKAFAAQAEKFLENLYLPVENEAGLIPQDDTFLQKDWINLDKYKAAQGTQGILLDYSRQEVNELQILKQADLVMLFYLFPKMFAPEIVKKNLDYYEKRTIHDSSLSKAIHAIVENQAGNRAQAYQFFQEACLIDLGSEPHSSDDGLHAASLGAIWLAVVFGFAGIDTSGELLEIAPNLPDAWQAVAFEFAWKGETISVEIAPNTLQLSKSTKSVLELVIYGEKQQLTDTLTINLEQKDVSL